VKVQENTSSASFRHLHAHARTHTHTHIPTQHMITHICAHTHVQTCTHTHTRTHTHTHLCAHTHAHPQTHNIHIYICTHTCRCCSLSYQQQYAPDPAGAAQPIAGVPKSRWRSSARPKQVCLTTSVCVCVNVCVCVCVQQPGAFVRNALCVCVCPVGVYVCNDWFVCECVCTFVCAETGVHVSNNWCALAQISWCASALSWHIILSAGVHTPNEAGVCVCSLLVCTCTTTGVDVPIEVGVCVFLAGVHVSNNWCARAH
jgi:hypothetical protein